MTRIGEVKIYWKTPTFVPLFQRHDVAVAQIAPHKQCTESASSFSASLDDVNLAKGEYLACAVSPVCGAPIVQV